MKYFKDRYLSEETTEKKARYSQVTSRLPDGRMMEEIREFKTNRLLSCTASDGEPFGKWVPEGNKSEDTLDYDFTLNRTDTACPENAIDTLGAAFTDNDTIGFIAPKLASGEPDFLAFLIKHTRYPVYARENNISGRVYLIFTITDKGTIENIAVKRSAHPVLDKEAARLIRKINFSSPPILKNKPVSICAIMPINFQLH